MKRLAIKSVIESLNLFKDRVIAINVDATKVFSDLLTIIGYFAISSYLGGLSYIQTYFKAFGVLSNLSLDITYISMVFVKDVLLNTWFNILLTLVFLMFFGITYFCSKYVWKAWFGYLILCILFGSSMMLTVGLGNLIGYDQAQQDWTTNSKLPIAQIISNPNSNDCSTRNMRNPRLLLEDKNYVYVFQPKSGSASDNWVHVIPKKCIKLMKVNPI